MWFGPGSGEVELLNEPIHLRQNSIRIRLYAKRKVLSEKQYKCQDKLKIETTIVVQTLI